MTLVMPTRVLVVGGGGREHALAWKLGREPGVNEVLVAPGSAGISTEPHVRSTAVDPLDAAAVVALAREHASELVIVGPEAPLAVGVADALLDAGIAVFGPSRTAARLETSKWFCHEVAQAAGVRTARARAFGPGDLDAAVGWIEQLAADGSRAVLKADGLAGGKGVIVTESAPQAIELVPSFLARGTSAGARWTRAGAGEAGAGAQEAGPPTLVIEERLEGREASVIAICAGTRAVALPAARDHKRLCDGDSGPNTGGMGAYSPLPDLDADAVEVVLDTVHRPLLARMAELGIPFTGFLYAGLMLTSDGPALLECNVRLGDPEAQVILPRVAGSLGPWLLAAARGHLPSDAPVRLPEIPGAAVGVVLAARGYPGDPRRGDPIEGLDEAAAAGALVFHAGTVGRPVPPDGFATNGGRVLTVVGRGPDLPTARRAAETAADAIGWHGQQRRHDIALEVPAPMSGRTAAPAGATA